ncbi:YtxH domain-containing protein [Arenivirga flava]|uniref:YtxH domain-containing protein n=1 Tax=Arenivirga flava TaxID=1930060 RepID=A0AA37UHK2_9MICO|nr:YtxH domain-containing protein [Arenivirga flava]GMA29074.1 hypothetical protein GCM10025874_23270 [Arenivirga flava]
MRGKLILVTGIAIGYVLGAKAGRERYEQIRRGASRLWNDPRVQGPVHQAEDFAKDKAPEVVEFLADGAKKIAVQVQGASRKGAEKAADATSTAASKAKSAAKTTARKAGSSRSTSTRSSAAKNADES